MIPRDQGGGGYTLRPRRLPKTKRSFQFSNQSPFKISFPISALLRGLGAGLSTWLRVLVLTFPFLVTKAPAQTPSDAIALEQQQKWADAAQVWKKVTTRNPRDASAFAALGVDLSRLQKYDEAAAAYRKALKLNPKLQGIQLNLALAEYKQGHWSAAAKALKAVLDADPGNVQAQTLLGMSYYALRNFDLAAKHLAPASKADPTNTELHQMLARSCLWAKMTDCALEEFRLLLQQSPDSASTHILMGEALDSQGKTDEAMAEFEAAIKISPKEPNVHFAIGYMHWRAQEFDKARKEFEEELAVVPNHEQALAYLADIEWKNDHPELALPLLEKSIQSNRVYRFAYVEKGAIHLAQKNYKEAEPALLQAVKLDPAEPDAHYQLGRLYQALGRKVEAERELKKTQELRERADQSVVNKMPAPKTEVNPAESK